MKERAVLCSTHSILIIVLVLYGRLAKINKELLVKISLLFFDFINSLR